MSQQSPETRADYRYFLSIPTRWIDNDMLGHVNNVVFYRYFETVVVKFTIEEVGIDWKDGQVVGYTVESLCRYWQPLTYPETVEAALRVGHLGRTSCRYEVALFGEGRNAPAATGYFVHVFVDRATERPVPIPPKLRAALERFR